MSTEFRVLLIALGLWLMPLAASAQIGPPTPIGFNTQVVDVFGGPDKRSFTMRYVLIRQTQLAPEPGIPPAPPEPVVMLFAGGDGVLNIANDGTIRTGLDKNFLVRERFEFAHHGLTVAVVDAPHKTALNGFTRTSRAYAAEMSRIIADLRRRTSPKTKVWLVGTSSGTLSAIGIAAWLPRQTGSGTSNVNASRPDGVVLTSTQTNVYPPAGGGTEPTSAQCGVTVFVRDPPSNPNGPMLIRNVNVPTHVVSAMADLCPCSSKPDRSQAVLDALMSAPTKDRIAFPGGDTQQSDVCQALTPHGYLHIENGPVSDIANWVKTH